LPHETFKYQKMRSTGDKFEVGNSELFLNPI
jgi:hypothetical protein